MPFDPLGFAKRDKREADERQRQLDQEALRRQQWLNSNAGHSHPYSGSLIPSSMASSSYPGTYTTTAGVPSNSWGHPDGAASDYYQDHSKSGQPPQISGQSQSAQSVSLVHVQPFYQGQSQGQGQDHGQNPCSYGYQNTLPGNPSGRLWAPPEGIPPPQQPFIPQNHEQAPQEHWQNQAQQGHPPEQHGQWGQPPPPPAQNYQSGWGHGGNGY